jgi:glycosyltransferase involved in cell wall biosynthesis
VDIIKKYPNVVTHWVSERDNGLYDAMNKGLQMATGEYVMALNAGDLLDAPIRLKKRLNSCKARMYCTAILRLLIPTTNLWVCAILRRLNS